jgi:hypothetical protein
MAANLQISTAKFESGQVIPRRRSCRLRKADHMDKPAGIVFIAGRGRVRFTGDGSTAPQLAILLTVREGWLEEFLGAPRLADMLIGDLPVLAVLEDYRDAAQLVRQLRLRNYPGIEEAEEIVDSVTAGYPDKPEAVPGPLPAPPYMRALVEMEVMLDTFWRLSVDLRLGGFPEKMKAPATALVDDLAKIFRVMDEHSTGTGRDKAWADLLVEMRRELPEMFAKLGEAVCAIVERASEDAG